MVDQAEIHIELSGDEPLSDIEMLSLGMEMAIRAKIPSLEKISIIPHSASDIVDKSASTKIMLYVILNGDNQHLDLIEIDKLKKIKHRLVKFTI